LGASENLKKGFTTVATEKRKVDPEKRGEEQRLSQREHEGRRLQSVRTKGPTLGKRIREGHPQEWVSGSIADSLEADSEP